MVFSFALYLIVLNTIRICTSTVPHARYGVSSPDTGSLGMRVINITGIRMVAIVMTVLYQAGLNTIPVIEDSFVDVTPVNEPQF